MAQEKRLICAAEALAERGKGVRFSVRTPAGDMPAFAVRYRGQAHAYVNRCAHAWVELDWNNGEFFDISGLYLVCATHGAAYRPDTGECMHGPCRGQKLVKLDVVEQPDGIYLLNEKES
jgi:nitrite reductase/ring-hydroxylating ferredoxin subunit